MHVLRFQADSGYSAVLPALEKVTLSFPLPTTGRQAGWTCRQNVDTAMWNFP